MIYNNIICCSHCMGENLHVVVTDVFDRIEDAETGLHLSVFKGCNISVDTLMKDNPSPRRDGLKLVLYCEDCGRRTELSIYQHKGKTFIG